MIFEFATLQCYRQNKQYGLLYNETTVKGLVEYIGDTISVLAQVSAEGWRIVYVEKHAETFDNDWYLLAFLQREKRIE